jgi:polysaccharide biosynthesis/export protein
MQFSSFIRVFLMFAVALSALMVRVPAHAQAAVSNNPNSATAQYRLAPGDGIRVFVYQNPDLSLELRLTESGTVSYPLLGSVNLAGLP